MADVNVHIMYKIEITPEEFRLIGKALSGMLLPEEEEACLLLSNKLLKQRVHSLETLMEAAKAAHKRSDELLNGLIKEDEQE